MAPMLGAEVFSAALGGLPAAMRALLGYLVYGATLGGIVGTVQPEGRYASQYPVSETLSPEPDMPSAGHLARQGSTCLTRLPGAVSKARRKTEDVGRLVSIALVTSQAFDHAERVGRSFEQLRELLIVECEAGALCRLRTGLPCGRIRLIGSPR